MFHIASKILGLVISPLLWVVGVIFLAFWVKKTKLKQRLFLTAFLVLLFFSNQFIISSFKSTIEFPAVKTDTLTVPYDYGIVLGGISTYDTKANKILFHTGADRLGQAVWLYKQKKIRKIIISGGNGNLLYKQRAEAHALRQYLVEIGISESNILIENNSKNTYQNAKYTAELLAQNKALNKTLLLITSSDHCLRAKLAFEKQGLSVDLFPTNIDNSKRFSYRALIIPSATALSDWESFLHEIIGLVSYMSMGYI